MTTSPPNAKRRRRTAPCFCVLCNGRERDHRTIKTHEMTMGTFFESPALEPPIFENNDDNYDNHDNYDNTPSQTAKNDVIKIPSDQITEFVVRELKTKLIRGHSRAALEEHLQNASKLIGCNTIPTKWCEVLKLLKSLGYKNPCHYKVCVTQTHSVLLKSKTSCPKCNRHWDVLGSTLKIGS